MRQDETIEEISNGGRPLGLFSMDIDDDELFGRAHTLLAGRNQEDDLMIMAIQRRP